MMVARQDVVAEALTWLHTPYHHHARIKGAGVDCAQLLCGVFEAVGMVEHIDTGFYPHDWHMSRNEELFLQWLAKVGARQVDAPQPGDVAVFRFGRTFSHGAVMIDEQTTIHAYINMGVIQTRLNEAPLDGRLVQFWSLF